MKFHLFIPYEKFNRAYILGNIHYFIMAANNKLQLDSASETNGEQKDINANTRQHFYQNFFVNEKNFNTFQFDFNTVFTKRVNDLSAKNINFLFSSKTKSGREKIKKMSDPIKSIISNKPHDPFSQKIEFEFEYYLDKNKILEEIHSTLKNEVRLDLPYMYSDFKPKKRGTDLQDTIEPLIDRKFPSDYFSFNIQENKTLMLNELMYELMYNPIYTKPLIINKLTHLFLAYLDTDLYSSLNKSVEKQTESRLEKKEKRKINLTTLSNIASLFAKERLGKDIDPIFSGELKLQIWNEKSKNYLKSPYIDLGESLRIYPGETNILDLIRNFDENDIGIFVERNFERNNPIGNYNLSFFNKKYSALESSDNWHYLRLNKKIEEAFFTNENESGISDAFLKLTSEENEPVHYRLDYVSGMNLSWNSFKRYVKGNKRLENIDLPFSEYLQLDIKNIYIAPKYMRINFNKFSTDAVKNNICNEKSDIYIYKHIHRKIEKEIIDRIKKTNRIEDIKNDLFDAKIQYCKHGRFYDFNFNQEVPNVFLSPDGYIILLANIDLEKFLVASGSFTKKELVGIIEGKLNLKKPIQEHKDLFIPDDFLGSKEDS